MINRYQGNSGRVVRYPEREAAAQPQRQRSIPERPTQSIAAKGPERGRGVLEGIDRLLPEKLSELESEDIILLLILYLMYRESGDSDLLIIMGAMFLL